MNDFEVIEQPTSISVTSVSAVAPATGICAGNPYLGIITDIKYTVDGTSGSPIETSILMVPFEGDLIVEPSNREPRATSFLLQWLENSTEDMEAKTHIKSVEQHINDVVSSAHVASQNNMPTDH